MTVDPTVVIANYEGQGGDNWHVSGTLDIESGGVQTIASGATLSVAPGATVQLAGVVANVRKRFTVAQVNAGAEILPAVAGRAYRLVSATAIAVGGAAGAVTTVDILATQSATSVKLVAFAQASLTQSTVLTAGGTGAAVLADGASFVANDTNTSITVGKTGGSVTTATHIDINLSYSLE